MNTGELGVIIDTHSGHRRFLKPCLVSARGLRAIQYVCAYNTILNDALKYATQDVMPLYDVMALADMWMIAEFGQRVNSWLWLQKYALALLAKGGKDVARPKYVFSIEGDCIITNPKGIHDLENKMVAENTDIICSEWQNQCYAGAVSYFAKLDAIIPIIDLMVQEAYKAADETGENYGNIEGRFGKAIKKLGIKCSDLNNPLNSHFSYGYRGTWGDCLGFKHLHGMEKWRMGCHHAPMPREWYDTRYLGPAELAALEYFWTTNDTSKLQEMGYWQETTPELLEQGIKYKEAP
jgi:hypothetical protein